MAEGKPSLRLSARTIRVRRVATKAGTSLLFVVTAFSMAAVLFIFYFITRDAIPFFQAEGFRDFFLSPQWYPSGDPPRFGVGAILAGSLLVTAGALLVAVPLGVFAAICLSEILPFSWRQAVKPVIEVLAAIPSVAYGFFALVVLAPLLQQQGGSLLRAGVWLIGLPPAVLGSVVLGDVLSDRAPEVHRRKLKNALTGVLGLFALGALWRMGQAAGALRIDSGTNALNVSIILGIMAMPTIVSVAEDALQAAGRDLREGSYALGATRAETLMRVLIPAAGSGIVAAVILGVMRAIGETMVVWMASGNAAAIPEPWYNVLSPVRTLTATIAGDMGEADHVTGSSRYAVLFAMALTLLTFSFLCNLASEWAVRRSRRRMAGG
jgi:phosphate transport system permease protein